MSRNVAFIGPACAGKTTAAEICRVKIVKFAEPLYKVIKVLGVRKDRIFLQELSDVIKRSFGPDFFVKAFSRQNSNNMLPMVCDDVRYMREFRFLKERGWQMVYIDADEPIRKARSDKLHLDWKPSHSSEREVEKIKNRCHNVITNNGTIEDFIAKINEVTL